MYKSSSFRFKLKDLDGDKIPELLATCDDTCAADGYERIYTYKKGKVKEVLTAGHGSFTFYPSKHMVCFSGAKAKYTKYVSKLKGKEFKMTYMKNTKQNRKKYLK